MLKKYLNTFKGSETQQKYRRFLFSIFALLFALLFSIYFAITKTFDNQFIALLINCLLGLICAIILDCLIGIERTEPLIKKNKKSFWDSSFKLTSEKGKEIISNPELSKKLIEIVRKSRKNK
jgi:hypothetical protein